MALVPIQCKNCGGALQVDSGATSYYCPHCRTTYAMEQTVNQTFQTTNIGTATIIDDGSGKIDQEISSGEAFLSLRKYQAARDAFQNLTSLYAHKYRTWWGLARALSEEFTKIPEGKYEFYRVDDAVKSAIQLAPANERNNMKEASAAYLTRWHNYCVQLSEERVQRLEKIEQRANELLSPGYDKIKALLSAIEKKTAKMEKMQNKKKVVPLVGFAVVGLLLFFMSIGSSGIFEALFMSAIAAGILVFLPLKLIFSFIINAIRVPTELVINHSNKEIEKIETEITAHKNQLDNEMHTVYADTGWLDR